MNFPSLNYVCKHKMSSVNHNNNEVASIVDFYRDKHILLTGATGFIGKVIIEKLLRSCDVGKIYCLIRPKKGQDSATRLKEICEQQLFDKLRQDSPDFSTKLQAVSGDIMDEELGIKETDRQTLEKCVNVVIHSAATVKFDECLKLAVSMNIVGVRKMVQLSKKMQKLEAFVHISTAYANCERQCIEDTVYPTARQPSQIIDMVEWMDGDLVNSITPKLIHPMPNTYTYTKQLAETLLLDEGQNLPVTIVRPSIVTASWAEPYPGWIDNYNGVSGLALATGKGLVQSVRAEPQFVADLIPVDLVANVVIAAGWHRSVHNNNVQNGQVFHITSGDKNPLTWQQMVNYGVTYFKDQPMEMCFRRPKYNMLTPNRILHNYWVLVSHLLPAYVTDFIASIVGSKPRMVKIYDRIHKAMSTLQYFTLRQWSWAQKSTEMLQAAMSDKEQQEFPFDARLIDWDTYTQNYCMGMKTFMLKENPENVEQARAHVRKLRNLRYCFNVCWIAILYKILQTKSCLITRVSSLVLGILYKLLQICKSLNLQLTS